MPDLSDPFLSPKLKIKRAERHIEELYAANQSFVESDPYDVLTEIDAQASRFVHKVRFLKTIPEDFPLIIGDVIQNLRASLDHAVCCLALQRRPTININDISFPIAGNRQEFEARAKKAIKKLSPEQIAFIKALKPYKGGNDQFWRLHRLGVRDRHRVLVTAWAAGGDLGIRFMPNWPDAPLGEEFPMIWIHGQNHFEPLQDGSIITTTPMGASSDSEIKHEIYARIHICFGDGEVVISEPIGPALVQLRDFVKGVIDAIEKRFFN